MRQIQRRQFPAFIEVRLEHFVHGSRLLPSRSIIPCDIAACPSGMDGVSTNIKTGRRVAEVSARVF
jgi:hypothetical protein